MLLNKRSDGSLGPADESDRLDKPCYDYKGLSRSRAFLETLVDSLLKVGIDVYQIDHEDANGQFEINFTYSDALTSADRMIFFRMAAGEIARSLARDLHVHAQATVEPHRQRHAHAPFAGRPGGRIASRRRRSARLGLSPWPIISWPVCWSTLRRWRHWPLRP